jgi:putative ABC transport system permease protein
MGVPASNCCGPASCHWRPNQLHQTWTRTFIVAIDIGGTLAARAALKRDAVLHLLTGQRAGSSPAFRTAGKALVIAQVALASAPLVVATSFSALISKLLNADLGLRPNDVITFTVAPSQMQYPDGAALRAFASKLVSRLRTLGVHGEAAAAWNTPVGEPFSVPLRLHDMPFLQIQFRPVTARYFDVLGIPLLNGRCFTDSDRNTAEAVAIVNAVFASRYLRGEPLGQHIELGSAALYSARRIVGIVGNTKQAGPDSPSEPIVYTPLAQTPDRMVGGMRQFLGLHFFLQTWNESAAISGARQIVREVASDEVVTGLGPLSAEFRKLSAGSELDLKCLSVMTSLAILVAIAGLYSLVSVSVASRKRDLGIKTALGASPRTIALDVLGNAAQQMGTGMMIGATAGILAAQYLRGVVPALKSPPPFS